MNLTEEQHDFQRAIRDFCARACATREQREALLDPDEEAHSTALYLELAQLGWLGVAIPEEYGGSGGTYVEQTILFEELWRGLAPVKALGATTTVAGCYKRFGSEDQKAPCTGGHCRRRGDVHLDLRTGCGLRMSLRSVARPARSVTGYVLNGRKPGAPTRIGPRTFCSWPALAETTSRTPV